MHDTANLCSPFKSFQQAKFKHDSGTVFFLFAVHFNQTKGSDFVLYTLHITKNKLTYM